MENCDSLKNLIIYFSGRKYICDPEYDPVTFIKTTRDYEVIKTSGGKCNVYESGTVEPPPNFQGALSGYPQQYDENVPCPSDPCECAFNC